MEARVDEVSTEVCVHEAFFVEYFPQEVVQDE